MKNYDKKITLYCPICGSDMFNSNDNLSYTCIKCGKSFSKEEIMEENQYIINENIEDIKTEIIEDIKQEIKCKLKGVKNLKWKL